MAESLKRDYQICEEIGKGQFGTIFRCLNPTTGEFFACKSIDKSQIQDELDLQLVQNEPKMMSYLTPHPNIINLRDFYEDQSHLYLILDLCQPFTSLYDVVSTAPLSEPQAASLIKPVVEAVAHCHRHGISHRDIKPENILFGYGSNELKLADFGSADWFGEGRTMEGIVGTPYYVAPEVLLGRGYNEKVDVWSLGVVLYVMLAGFVPFYGEDAGEIFEAVVRGNLRFPTKALRNVSKEAKELLRKMICRDVSRRLSADQVLRHPWIVSGGKTEAAELDVM